MCAQWCWTMQRSADVVVCFPMKFDGDLSVGLLALRAFV